MNSIESPIVEADPAEEESAGENEVEQPKIENALTKRLVPQKELAKQLYARIINPKADFEKSGEDRNAAMIMWTEGGDESYSKAFKDMEDDPEFQIHPRLQGDVESVTLEDIMYYKVHRKFLD